VIDVSGDGVNNSGPIVTMIRDDIVAAGITINGLPIMLNRQYRNPMDIDNLDVYYEDCVIGGPGSFVIPIKERSKFIEATRTKLVLEIASIDVFKPRVYARLYSDKPAALPVAADKPRVSCTIGEKIWQERWGDGYR
jgi:hypothetical protein